MSDTKRQIESIATDLEDQSGLICDAVQRAAEDATYDLANAASELYRIAHVLDEEEAPTPAEITKAITEALIDYHRSEVARNADSIKALEAQLRQQERTSG